MCTSPKTPKMNAMTPAAPTALPSVPALDNPKPLPISDTKAPITAGMEEARKRRLRQGYASTLLSTPATRSTGSVAKKMLLGQ